MATIEDLKPQPPIDAATIEEEFEARKVEFARSCPDFEETVESVRDCVVFPHIAEFIKTAKRGIEVGYYLAKNRQVLSMIHDLDAAAALEELWRLEAKLTPAPSAWPWCEPWWIECFLEPFEPAAALEPPRSEAAAASVADDGLVSGAIGMDYRWADDQELRRRVGAFAATVPDYYPVLDSTPWKVPRHVEAYIRASMNGPRLGYYLAKHRHLYAAIIETSPTYAIARLLSLDRQLEQQSQSVQPEILYSVEYTLTPTAHEVQVAAQILRLFGWDHQQVSCPN
jgi:hypothetical protein